MKCAGCGKFFDPIDPDDPAFFREGHWWHDYDCYHENHEEVEDGIVSDEQRLRTLKRVGR